MCACSEVIDIKSKDIDRTYLVVEALLTDEPDIEQAVTLTESVSYFAKGEVPEITGADVRVSDGETETVFTESTETPGRYIAPDGWCCAQGKTYHLSVSATVGGKPRTCVASEAMPKRGFTVTDMDYAYTTVDFAEDADSLWTLSVWGKDEPGKGYLTVRVAVNGNYRPIASGLSLDDTYFAGRAIAGFPIFILGQNAENQKKYGDAAKFLETGDVLTLTIYSMTKEYFDFVSAVGSNTSASSIPLFSTRPANCQTNIEGEDTAGWFAVCAASSASRTVDDPLRKTTIVQ